MLFFIAVSNILSDCEEVRVTEVVLVSGIGPIGSGVTLSRDVRGTGRLTGRLSHILRGGVVLAVIVVAEARVLESVFSFRGVDVSSGQSIEADGLPFDDLGVGGWTREDLVGKVELRRSQFTTF